MAEAKKLAPPGGPTGLPVPVPLHEAGLPPLPSELTASDGMSLPPPPQAAQALPRLVVPVSAAPDSRIAEEIERVSRTALIVFVIGLVAFIAGIAMAACVLLGMLDLQTGWVKDLLMTIKGLVRSFTAK